MVHAGFFALEQKTAACERCDQDGDGDNDEDESRLTE